MKFISNNFSFYISSRDTSDNVIRSGFIALFIEKTQKLSNLYFFLASSV